MNEKPIGWTPTQEEAAAARDELDAETARMDKAVADAGVPNEATLYESNPPWPKTEEEMLAQIRALVKRPHTYGTCVYAMSLAALAAFRYVAHELGVTGFQASCADLDIVRRTRSIKGPFCIVNGEDALYPQYDLRGKLEERLREWRPWAQKEAQKMLADPTHKDPHPNVAAHWKRLAEGGSL